MKFDTFSEKQLLVLSWWTDNSKLKNSKGIICDGSVRSGKTLSMSMSFVMWAMYNFDGVQFGMSGKSVGAMERNIIFWLIPALSGRGYKVQYKDNCLIVSIYSKRLHKKITNYFYIFGGKDKVSYTLIQGLTAGGWLFDEVALQPEGFVNQAMSRCSIDGSKYFFNCNPDGPTHWFKKNFVDMAEEKNLLHIHFLMNDNPSLSQEIIEEYESMFKGTFYLRYIKGLWVLSEGIIFDSFDNIENVYTENLSNEKKVRMDRYLAIDYGIANPFAVLDIYDNWDTAYVDNEIYYDSSEKNLQLTDEHYLEMIKRLDKSSIVRISAIVIDPSALSLIVLLRNEGYRVKPADNDVMEGIKVTHSAFHQKKLMVNKRCKKFINELNSYIWDDKARERGEEKPLKLNDHACVAGETIIHSFKSKNPIKYLSNEKSKQTRCYSYDEKIDSIIVSNIKEVAYIGYMQCIKIVTDDDDYLIATPDHRIRTINGYEEIRSLKIGDVVKKAIPINLNSPKATKYKFANHKIIDINDVGKQKVYDATIINTHNYICNNGFISHNCDCIRYYCNTIMKKRILHRI